MPSKLLGVNVAEAISLNNYSLHLIYLLEFLNVELYSYSAFYPSIMPGNWQMLNKWLLNNGDWGNLMWDKNSGL